MFPALVNFTALLNKLIKTCRIFPTSPRRAAGSEAAVANTKEFCLAAAKGRNICRVSSNMMRRSNESGTNCTRPASMRDISSTSLTICKRWSPLERMVAAFLRGASASWGSFSSNWA